MSAAAGAEMSASSDGYTVALARMGATSLLAAEPGAPPKVERLMTLTISSGFASGKPAGATCQSSFVTELAQAPPTAQPFTVPPKT